MIKIHGGTPTDHYAPSLCKRCRESQIITERMTGRVRQICHSHGNPIEIHGEVSECTSFDDKAAPALWQMEKVAWRFRVDDKRKTVGFLTPKDFRERFPDDD